MISLFPLWYFFLLLCWSWSAFRALCNFGNATDVWSYHWAWHLQLDLSYGLTICHWKVSQSLSNAIVSCCTCSGKAMVFASLEAFVGVHVDQIMTCSWEKFTLFSWWKSPPEPIGRSSLRLLLLNTSSPSKCGTQVATWVVLERTFNASTIFFRSPLRLMPLNFNSSLHGLDLIVLPLKKDRKFVICWKAWMQSLHVAANKSSSQLFNCCNHLLYTILDKLHEDKSEISSIVNPCKR